YRANVTSRPTLRVEPAQPCRHMPANNAVAQAQARIAAFARPSPAASPPAPEREREWEWERGWDEKTERSASAI
ncbi:MAG: hypothetical protein PSX79_08945, partial [bacterium]|nr:hypothetical protein [bacterium]